MIGRGKACLRTAGVVAFLDIPYNGVRLVTGNCLRWAVSEPRNPLFARRS